MKIIAPDGGTFIIEKAQSGQRGGTLWHLSCHIWALIATAEPGNCPREPFSLPLKGHSQGRWNQGAGGACTPKISNTPKVPFFLSKKCPFKVNHAPVLLRKSAFSSIFKSLNAIFFPWRACTVIIEKAQSGQRAHLCLNGAFITFGPL